MVSTSGAQLLPVEAVQILLRELLPLTTILTPNVPEAKLLLSQAGAIFNADPQSVDDLIELGKQIHKLGPKHVLLKGGHLPLPTSKDSPEKNKTVSNILISDDCATQVIQFSFLETSSSHGTGCSLACKFIDCTRECIILAT
jgi:hydroxymethylpyrimidine/phosphomethylpyrimidine kinase